MDPISLSVTQLCRASTDAAWLDEWLAGDNPPLQVFGPPGSVTAHGTQFHNFAYRVVRHLLQHPSVPAEADRIYHLLLDEGAGALLESLLDSGQIDSAAQLTQALHFFAQRVVEVRRRVPGASWADVFVAPELGLKDVRFDVDGGLVFVSGAIDCVRQGAGRQTEVVDYKLSRGSDLPKEMVQVAIYRKLIERHNGTSAVGVLEYFAPALHVQELSEGDLEACYQHWVVPALKRIVAARQPASTRKPAVAPTPAALSPKSANPEGATPRALRVGKTRGVAPAEVTLDPEQLKRHVAVLGGSGSGKTTLALSIIEQLLVARVPVLLVDRKGDLCRYGDPHLGERPGGSEALSRLLASTHVAVFTPGQDRGRGLSISLLPPGIHELEASERSDAYKNAAAGLGAMLQLKSGAADQAKLAVLVQGLRLLGESRRAAPVDLSTLIELMGSDEPALPRRAPATSTTSAARTCATGSSGWSRNPAPSKSFARCSPTRSSTHPRCCRSKRSGSSSCCPRRRRCRSTQTATWC
jgi:hypothetical protein